MSQVILVPPALLHLGATAVIALLGLLLLAAWQRERDPALGLAAASHLLTGLGMTLVAGRGGELPVWLAIGFGNALFLAGHGYRWMSARVVAHNGPWRHAMAWAPALAWLLACLVPDFLASLHFRIVLASVLTAVISLLTAYAARPRSSRPPRGLAWIFMALNLCHAGFFLARAGLAGLLPEPMGIQLPPSGAVFTLFAMEGVIFWTASAVLQIALGREDALARSVAAARAASEAKSRFVTRVGHELRTPLNAVLGFSQLLARDTTLGPAQREQAQLAEREARHLRALVDDLMDLAQAEAGRLRVTPRPMAPRRLLEGCIASLGPLAAERRLRLRLQLGSLPPGMLADPLRLRQALLNMLGNAVKYTPEGGEVVLSARQDAGSLLVEVADSGPGIPEPDRARLFQDFARLDLTPSAGGAGSTGLGLSITAALAEAMGGAVGHRQPAGGHGAVFWLRLPCIEVDPPPEEALPCPALRAGRLRVLVVDDMPAQRRLVAALLAAHETVAAADAEAALDLLTHDLAGFDAVLMDGQLPGMDGVEATRRLRAMPGPVSQIPVIALSASADAEGVARFLAAGATAHLAKPVDRAALLETLTRVTAGNTAKAR